MTTTLEPADLQSAPAEADAPERRSQRDEAAVAVFASWMLFGLFLDGWAHGAEKPETFFSPWHGVLYSGFAAALLWFGVDGVRSARAGREASLVPADRLTGLGLVLFAAGAVGDGVWHEIFGVEVDLEALLSPTHLLLLVGGFLMVTGPVRTARDDPDTDTSTLWRFLPTAVTLTLATALVSFFTLYLSAFQGVGLHWAGTDADVRELTEVVGVGAVLVTNLLLLTPVLFALRHWRTPHGTFTLLFTVVAVGMTGLDGFDRVELALAGVLGGITADVLVRAGRSPRVVAAVVPLVTWSAFFVVVGVGVGIDWAVELVAGSVVLAAASGVLLAALVEGRPAVRSGGSSGAPTPPAGARPPAPASARS
jgi:hypothetical protein